MSFSFRNVFSPGDDESSNGQDNPFSAGGAPRESSPATPSKSSGGEVTVRRKFLLSELLALIPPAIAATSGISIDDEVELPIPVDHGNDIRLSLLYHVCPQLFAAEITPLNDSTITLPGKVEEPAKSKSFSGEAADFSGGNASGREAPEAKDESASWKTYQPKVEMKQRDGERQEPDSSPQETSNPFSSSPSKEKETPNPFGMGGMTRGEVEKIPGGFDSPGLESESGSPFEWPPEPGSEGEEPTAAENEEEQNPFTSSEGFSTLFSKKAQDDEDIPFPGAGENEALKDSGGQPESPKPPASEEKWGSMFESTPTDEKAETPMPTGFTGFGEMLHHSSQGEDREPEEKTLPEVAPKESVPVVSEEKFVQEPLGKEKEEVELVDRSNETYEREVEQEKPEEFPADPWAKSTPQETPEQSVKPEIEVTASVGPLHSQTKSDDPVDSAPEPFSSKPVEFSTPTWLHKAPEMPSHVTDPAEETFVEPAPEPKEIESAEASATPPPLPFYREGDDPDLILRAIFSTDENFTFSKLARRVVSLPGINGCAIANQSKLVQASTSDRSRVGDHARDMVSTIRNLASFTGLSEARVFTLHTDKGIVSLFLEGNCCLTVHQDSVEFGPGIREKLTLIARCLEKLKE
ncbi:MAG: hypothetical protein CMO55_13715 [Verrucomicrobiales bacterium]|nr:hypothetical protein [Verrucomicrobiales bacterium]